MPIEAKGHGQAVLSIDLQPVANEMGKAAARLRERQPGQVGKFDRKRYVVHNAWVVAGTRIPTEAIWNFHEAGYNTKAIIAEYLRLVPADVRFAIEFESTRRKRSSMTAGPRSC